MRISHAHACSIEHARKRVCVMQPVDAFVGVCSTDNNILRFLHPRMSELQSLTLLSAANNRLTMLPASLATISCLRSLTLAGVLYVCVRAGVQLCVLVCVCASHLFAVAQGSRRKEAGGWV